MEITGRPMKGWVMVEGDELEDDDLVAWIEQARAFSGANPPKQRQREMKSTSMAFYNRDDIGGFCIPRYHPKPEV